ncbi:MAG: hypothetical protein JXA54_01865 [Candidatus Heimdallarchaeota archaeon]|nr:hypothetical protein [Candidatus Heimdallarchaeota archaeon]
MGTAKKFRKTLQRKLSKVNLSRSNSLTLILVELKKIARLNSCLLTDENGLSMAQVLNPLDDKENLSATTALIKSNADRINDYIKTGPINISYFASNNLIIWVTPIKIPNCKDSFILFISKKNSILERMSKSTLRLLSKKKINIYPLIEIATTFISQLCKA